VAVLPPDSGERQSVATNVLDRTFAVPAPKSQMDSRLHQLRETLDSIRSEMNASPKMQLKSGRFVEVARGLCLPASAVSNSA
jgi:hypothetical protein